MVFLLLFLSALLQVILYLLLHNVKYGQLAVLAVLLILHFFLLPKLFLPERYTPEEGYQCALPTVATYFFFWVFGGGVTLITHACYYFIRRILKKKNS